MHPHLRAAATGRRSRRGGGPRQGHLPQGAVPLLVEDGALEDRKPVGAADPDPDPDPALGGELEDERVGAGGVQLEQGGGGDVWN